MSSIKKYKCLTISEKKKVIASVEEVFSFMDERQCRGQNVPMGGSLLKEKAKASAKKLGIEFSASKGWCRERS
ncbi:hypothetical protein TNCV_2066231 [Trichonephila clavipes]|nr:hypothetical protein TNCV_2066231 [Trichonephila clavipes]